MIPRLSSYGHEGRAERPPASDAGLEARMADLLAASRRLIEAVAQGQSEETVLQLGLELAADLVKVRFGALGIIDERRHTEHFLFTGMSAEQAARIGHAPRGHGLLGKIIEERGVLRLNNLARSADAYGFPANHPVMDSLLAAPLFSLGRPYGRLYLCDRRDGAPFSAADELVVAHFSQYLTLAIERSVAGARLRSRDEEARLGEERYRLLLEMSPDPVLVVQDDTIALANLPAAQVVGAEAIAEVIGRPFLDLIHPDFVAAARERIALSETLNRLPRTEYRIRRMDRRHGWIEAETARISYFGRPAALIVARDVSELRRDAARLRALHSLAETVSHSEDVDEICGEALSAMRATLEPAHGAILLRMRDGLLRRVASDRLPQAADTVFDWPWPSDQQAPLVLSRSQGGPALRELLEHIGLGQLAAAMIVPLLHQGRPRGVLVAGYEESRTFDEDEQRLALTIAEQVAVAVSRQRAVSRIRRLNVQLEERVRWRTRELEQANRELEAFSYSVSHDLRAPLRAINGFSTILLGDYAGKLDDEAVQYLNRIIAASRRMEVLIDDLLRLARVKRGEIELSMVDLTAEAREIAAKLSESQPERRVRWEIAPSAPVEADRGLIRILLENLLGNAWKYTSKQPDAVIRFEGFPRNGQRVFRVIDNGAGLDMRYAEKLFEPFQRLHASREFEGSGVGLALSKRIVSRHGGSIRADGQPGRGSVFEFTLWEEGIPGDLRPAESAGP